MLRRRTLAFAFATGSSLFAGVLPMPGVGEGTARANPMDLAPDRLTTCDKTSPIACGTVKLNAAGTGYDANYFRPDNAAWAKLLSQYAMAIAPLPMHPARTTGYGGFELSLFGQITTISKDGDVLQRGTEGAITASNKFPSSNASPDSVLQLYGVTGRKGLPYGFELQGSVGYMANTELVALGGGIRLSPFEGFRSLFDLSAGGYVHTLTGSSKVKVTVPSFDIQISRAFVVANQVVITPMAGWQMVWINADSSVIDTTSAVEGLKDCNARPATPAERAAGDTGEFHCQEKLPDGTLKDATSGAAKLDLNNNVVFKNMRAYRRQRLLLGVSIRYEIAHLMLTAAPDLIDPADGAADDDGKKRLEGLPKQWTFGAQIGLSW